MLEEDAKHYLAHEIGVPRGTFDRLEQIANHVRKEAINQNLVSAASLKHIWSRHILDSAQLIGLGPTMGSWLDMGTGAGFPGLVVAVLHSGPVKMVEQRRRRADFLTEVVKSLDLRNAEVVCADIAKMPVQRFDIISARAFAPLDRLFTLGLRFADKNTRWLLPKGRNAQTELEAVTASWQGDFTLEPSLTDADARILVAENVRPTNGKGVR